MVAGTAQEQHALTPFPTAQSLNVALLRYLHQSGSITTAIELVNINQRISPSKMRRSTIYCLLFAAFLVFIFGSHVKVLVRSFVTFTAFGVYVFDHPRTLYSYPPAGNLNTEVANATALVPLIIHRILLDEGRNVSPSHDDTLNHNTSLSHDVDTTTSCQRLHPEWTHLVWTDNNASMFMKLRYPEIYPHYQGYRQTIQRANILRYALLHHYGGVYLDWDIACLQPLDNLRYLPWLTPGAYPTGVNNAFILSRTSHPFLAQLLQQVPSSDLTWVLPYVENMLSTGCMFFSNTWMSYDRPSSEREDGELYVLSDERGQLEPHMLRGAVTTPLFRHGGASSWHSWDAGIIIFAGKHCLLVIVLAVVGTVVGTMVCGDLLIFGIRTALMAYLCMRHRCEWLTSRRAGRKMEAEEDRLSDEETRFLGEQTEMLDENMRQSRLQRWRERLTARRACWRTPDEEMRQMRVCGDSKGS